VQHFAERMTVSFSGDSKASACSGLSASTHHSSARVTTILAWKIFGSDSLVLFRDPGIFKANRMSGNTAHKPARTKRQRSLSTI
jgi:hypothetical protein